MNPTLQTENGSRTHSLPRSQPVEQEPSGSKAVTLQPPLQPAAGQMPGPAAESTGEGILQPARPPTRVRHDSRAKSCIGGRQRHCGHRPDLQHSAGDCPCHSSVQLQLRQSRLTRGHHVRCIRPEQKDVAQPSRDPWQDPGGRLWGLSWQWLHVNKADRRGREKAVSTQMSSTRERWGAPWAGSRASTSPQSGAETTGWSNSPAGPVTTTQTLAALCSAAPEYGPALFCLPTPESPASLLPLPVSGKEPSSFQN